MKINFISPLEEPQPSAGQDNGWISTDERLPEKGKWYIGWSDKRECLIVFLDGSIDEDTGDLGTCWLGVDGDLRDDEEITHWMPLPSPPKTLNS